MRFMTVSLCGGARGGHWRGRVGGPCRGYWEVQGERAAARRLAVDLDKAAVPAHGVIDDRQPEAAALWSAPEAAVDAIEFAENPLLLAPRDADPLILHTDEDVAVGLTDVDVDGA
jgi:hypothetical protein